MFFDPANLNVHVLKTLVKKLTEKYTHAIRNDRPLKDAKEIKKAIHYVERKIAQAESHRGPRSAEEPRTKIQEPN